MDSEASKFETSEMVATFLASTPLVRESWRLCAAANEKAAMGFVTELRGGIGYLAFSGVQTPDSISDPTWGHVVPLETAGHAVFGPLLSSAGDCDLDGADKIPAKVHSGLLQLFLSMLNSQTFISQVFALKEKCKAIVITGHSLGGATASLTTLWLLSQLQQLSDSPKLLCITFGAPLLGNEAFTKAVLRERWGANFCHVVAKHDVMPRLLFAPSVTLTPQMRLLLQHWHSKMSGTPLPAGPAVGLELFGAVVASMERLGEAGERLFWPFGNYLMFSREGAVCLDDAACVVKMMHLMLITGFESGDFGDDHLNYGEYVARVPLQYLKQRSFDPNELPQTSYEAGLALALHSTGIPSQVPEATLAKDCLTTARRLGLAPILNCAKLAINLSKFVPYRAQIEWYKASCDEADDQMGYYDAFKRRGSSKRGDRINLNRHMLADFWDSVIEKLENNQLPHDFQTRNKWVNTFHFYKLLVEPLDIAEYYRKERHLVSGHYLSNGRPRRYKISDMWWRERRAGEEQNTARTKYASQTQDSCFWARLEQAKERLDILQTEDGAGNLEIWDKVNKFDEYAKGLVERKEVSKDVVAKNSSYTKWTQNLRKLSSAMVFPVLSLSPGEA